MQISHYIIVKRQHTMTEENAYYLLKKNFHNRSRETLLKQISSENETKIRHKNAMEERRLRIRKDGLVQSIKEHNRRTKKDRHLIKHQVRDIPKIKTLSVEQHMDRARQRMEGKRLVEHKRISKMFRRKELRSDELLVKRNNIDNTDVSDEELATAKSVKKSVTN